MAPLGREVRPESRVDWRLLGNLRTLDRWLQKRGLQPEVSHALIGKYVYLYYLRHRSVLTDLAILGATTLAVPQAAVAHHRHRRPAEAEPILAESIIPGRDVQPSS